MQPIQWGAPLKTANTNRNGTGTVEQIFKALVDTYIRKVRFMPLGDNADCVGRVFVNNGGETTSSQNNAMLDEVDLPPVSGSGHTGKLTAVDMTFDPPIMLRKGHRLTAAVSVDLTGSAGYTAIAIPVDPATLV
jgi:hypothetical protein